MGSSELDKIRLWGLAQTKNHPLSPEEVVKARSTGLNRTNSFQWLKQEVLQVDHQPLLQTSMSQTATACYKPACWLRGICRENKKLHHQQDVLRRILLREIKKQLQEELPGSAAKDVLLSGDIVIGIRFFERCVGSGASSVSSANEKPRKLNLWLFQLGKVCLRPEMAVLIHLQSEADADNYDGSAPHVLHADFERDPDTGFKFCTTWELCVLLLKSLPPATGSGQGVIWCNAMKANLLYLGSKMSWLTDFFHFPCHELSWTGTDFTDC